jgi:RNA polymerase sigma factor (sigma-70 family)
MASTLRCLFLWRRTLTRRAREISMSTTFGATSQPSNPTVPQAGAGIHAATGTARLEDGLSAFLSVRRRLFSIAYRMLGSAAEAEDVVQDVWVRWQTTDRSLVRDAPAFLATTATRLAINIMQSARSRRETPVGPWLPEPVDASADPGLDTERGDALKLGVQVLLKKLSPTERAAYILREAFDYAYRDIANVLRLEEANARQVVTRARQRVGSERRDARELDRAATSSRFVPRGSSARRRGRPRSSAGLGRPLDPGMRERGVTASLPDREAWGPGRDRASSDDSPRPAIRQADPRPARTCRRPSARETTSAAGR